jgi:hypothetical protein
MPTDEEIDKIMEPFEETNYDGAYIIAWDWYVIGGRFRNHLETKTGLKCDGALIKDLKDLSDLGCYAYIDMEGNALARHMWNGDNYIEVVNFDQNYQKVLEESKDGYLTVIDIHD